MKHSHKVKGLNLVDWIVLTEHSLKVKGLMNLPHIDKGLSLVDCIVLLETEEAVTAINSQ